MRVAIAGGFDPFHEGHLDHLVKASKLGDYLIVMINSDQVMLQKKGKCYEPLWFRTLVIQAIMKHLSIKGEVIPITDKGLTCTETLRKLKPDIFAKGGDRTPDNMPREETEVCREIGCKIIYSIGDQLNNSSKAEGVQCQTSLLSSLPIMSKIP